MENEIKEYTVTIYTENQIGLLSQITNVFTRHGLSIWSLSAGASSMEGVHNITIVTAGLEKKVKESVQQIEKRVDVIKAFFYTADKIVYRDLYRITGEHPLKDATELYASAPANPMSENGPLGSWNLMSAPPRMSMPSLTTPFTSVAT